MDDLYPASGDAPKDEPRPGIWFFAIFAAAVVLSTLANLHGGGNGTAVYWFAAVLSVALGIFVPTGLLAMLWWGVRKFERNRAEGPFAAWLIMVGIIGTMANHGALLKANQPGIPTQDYQVPASTAYEYQPPGCEFVVRFPSSPERTGVNEQTFAELHEMEVTTNGALLRAGCDRSAGELLRDVEILSNALTGHAKLKGWENSENTYKVTGEVTIASVTGTKLVEGRESIYEHRWYIGRKSTLVVTTAGSASDYPSLDVKSFHDSISYLGQRGFE